MKNKNSVLDQGFIGIYPGLLPPEDCKTVIEEFNKAEAEENSPKSAHSIKHGHTYHLHSKVIRLDKNIFANESMPEVHAIINKALEKGMQMYTDYFFPASEVLLISTQTKVQKTSPRGGFHKWHCECISLDSSNRALAWMIYLNDVAEGEGETEFLWQGLRIQPKAGTVCIWPAIFTHMHRGNPVYSQDKYIATGWFTYAVQ